MMLLSDGELGNSLDIEVEPDLEGRVVVVAHGVIDLREVPDLQEVLLRACDGDNRGIVLDLADVSFVGSSGIGLLVQVQQELARTRRTLTVRGASPSIRKAFSITQLDRVIELEESPGMGEEPPA